MSWISLHNSPSAWRKVQAEPPYLSNDIYLSRCPSHNRQYTVSVLHTATPDSFTLHLPINTEHCLNPAPGFCFLFSHHWAWSTYLLYITTPSSFRNSQNQIIHKEDIIHTLGMLWRVTQWLTGRHRHRHHHDTVTGRHCFETARAVLGAATGRGPRRRDCGIWRGGIVTLALSRGCPLSIAVLCSGLSHHGSENIIRYIP